LHARTVACTPARTVRVAVARTRTRTRFVAGLLFPVAARTRTAQFTHVCGLHTHLTGWITVRLHVCTPLPVRPFPSLLLRIFPGLRLRLVTFRFSCARGLYTTPLPRLRLRAHAAVTARTVYGLRFTTVAGLLDSRTFAHIRGLHTPFGWFWWVLFGCALRVASSCGSRALVYARAFYLGYTVHATRRGGSTFPSSHAFGYCTFAHGLRCAYAHTRTRTGYAQLTRCVHRLLPRFCARRADYAFLAHVLRLCACYLYRFRVHAVTPFCTCTHGLVRCGCRFLPTWFCVAVHAFACGLVPTAHTQLAFCRFTRLYLVAARLHLLRLCTVTRFYGLPRWLRTQGLRTPGCGLHTR